MRPRFYIAALIAFLVIAFACLAYPLYVIRPFRAQGVRELAAALAVTRYRGLLTAICAAGAVLACAGYWLTGLSRAKRIAFTLVAAAVCAFAVLCRVNVYELMFHPDTHPAFAPAATAKLDSDEMLIAVRVGPAARAYPIRAMAYHHIINDVAGGVPIAATY